MKKYCLTNKAKNQLKEILGILVLLLIGVVLTVIAAGMVTMAEPTAPAFLAYLGLISWCTLIASLTVAIPMWIYRSLEEC